MTDNTIHICLDLETWGTRPGYDLRSIGACVFTPHARHGGSLIHDGSLGTIKPFYIATNNPVIGYGPDWVETLGFTPNKIDPCYNGPEQVYRKYPLHRDPETVAWWNDQSAEAQVAFADPVDLRDALKKFGCWLNDITADPQPPAIDGRFVGDRPNVRIWSHGAAFDPPILAAAYEAVGLPVPWHYRAPRDTRTAFDMAGVEDHSAFLARFDTGTHHHALDDAICEARAICEAFRMVRAPMPRIDEIHRLCEEGTQAHGDEFYGRILDIIGNDASDIAPVIGSHLRPTAFSRIDEYNKTYAGGMSPGSRPSIERFARWLDTGKTDA